MQITIILLSLSRQEIFKQSFGNNKQYLFYVQYNVLRKNM